MWLQDGHALPWELELHRLPGTEPCSRPLQLSVSGGDIAPLVGHNAFLRWDALQHCAFSDPADGVRKFWSESHVSEDFDCALRFQVRGCPPRWCVTAGAHAIANDAAAPEAVHWSALSNTWCTADDNP